MLSTPFSIKKPERNSPLGIARKRSAFVYRAIDNSPNTGNGWQKERTPWIITACCEKQHTHTCIIVRVWIGEWWNSWKEFLLTFYPGLSRLSQTCPLGTCGLLAVLAYCTLRAGYVRYSMISRTKTHKTESQTTNDWRMEWTKRPADLLANCSPWQLIKLR